jgi:hypothetical protein
MPILAASLIFMPRMMATRLRPARFDSTYVSEKEWSDEGAKSGKFLVTKQRKRKKWDGRYHKLGPREMGEVGNESKRDSAEMKLLKITYRQSLLVDHPN